MSDTIFPTKRTSWFGTTFWVVVGGLLLLNISVFIECFDPVTIQQCLFRLDFRYWLPSLARPLWLIFALLAVDAVTFRQRKTGMKKWLRLLCFVLNCLKLSLIIYIFCLIYTLLFPPIRKPWLIVWYIANVPLFLFFWTKWMQIYETRTQTDCTPEVLNVRKKFLAMSITIASELGIYNVLLATGFNRLFSYALWRWFGFGAYSHWAAAAFILICLSVGLTIFVLKEWLVAIRQAWKINKTTSPLQQSEVSHDT